MIYTFAWNTHDTDNSLAQQQMAIRISMVARAASLAILTLSFGAQAQNGWFGNLSLGNVETRFNPRYEFLDGSPPEKFKDETAGWAASVGGGYRHDINALFSVDIAADYIRQGTEWTLYLPAEPASLKYEIPQTLAVHVALSWAFAQDWRLFADLGLARGQVRERKTSPVNSSYRFDDWVDATMLGAGISYDLDEKTSLSLAYRQLRFDKLTYRSYLPDGTHWETIEDSPTSSIIGLGLTYRF